MSNLVVMDEKISQLALLGFSVGKFEPTEDANKERVKELIADALEDGYEISVPTFVVLRKEDTDTYVLVFQDAEHSGFDETYDCAEEAIERFLEFTWQE